MSRIALGAFAFAFCLARLAIAETDVSPVLYSGETMASGAPTGNDCCPSAIHCDAGACDCCSLWYFRAEALFLDRDNDAINQPLVVSGATGNPLLLGQDIGFDAAVGPSLLLGRRIDGCSAWELSYFGTHFWDTTATVVGINDLDLPGVIVATANDFDNADRMDFRYTSQLHNAEFNYVRDYYEQVSLLVGFRYINWEETFNIQAADNDGDISDYNVRASNNLYGGQIGARLYRSGQALDWELSGKVGLFGNDAQHRQLLLDNGNTFVVRDTLADGSELSFVADLNLSASYCLNDTWSLRGGYNLMWITGLALAPNQLDFTDDALSGTNLNTDGDVFLHGVNVGLEARW